MKKSIIINGTNDQSLSGLLSKLGVSRVFVDSLEKAKKLVPIINKGNDIIFIINCAVSSETVTILLNKKEGIHLINGAKLIVIENGINADAIFEQYKTWTPPPPPPPPPITQIPAIKESEKEISQDLHEDLSSTKEIENSEPQKKPKKSKKKVYDEVISNQEIEDDPKTTANDSVVI